MECFIAATEKKTHFLSCRFEILNAGSGLHTFVLYLGPHVALFTIKAVQCGRIDLKMAPYDTIQLKVGPSWLDKKCSEFGPPVYPASAHSVRIPVLTYYLRYSWKQFFGELGLRLASSPLILYHEQVKLQRLYFSF